MAQSRLPYDVCATSENQKQSEGVGNRQLDAKANGSTVAHTMAAGIDNMHFVDNQSVYHDRIQMESKLFTIGNKTQKCTPANGGGNMAGLDGSKAPFQNVESHRFLSNTDNPREKSQSRGQSAFNVFFTHDLKPVHGVGRVDHVDTRQLAKDQYRASQQ